MTILTHRWVADAVSGQDYDPFGMVRPNRSASEDGYRFGFNGKEKDNEFSNESYDFGARIYDGRVAQWLSVDPLAHSFPFYSPFLFSNNNPLVYNDPSGRAGIRTITGAGTKDDPKIITITASYVYQQSLNSYAKNGLNDGVKGLNNYQCPIIEENGEFYQVKFNLNTVEVPNDVDLNEHAKKLTISLIDPDNDVRDVSIGNTVKAVPGVGKGNKQDAWAFANAEGITYYNGEYDNLFQMLSSHNSSASTEDQVDIGGFMSNMYKNISIHEILHNIGLDHITGSSTEIMQPMIDAQNNYDLRKTKGGWGTIASKLSVPNREVTVNTMKSLIKGATAELLIQDSNKQYKHNPEAIGGGFLSRPNEGEKIKE